METVEPKPQIPHTQTDTPNNPHQIPEESVARPKKTFILYPTVILLIIVSGVAGYLGYQNFQLRGTIKTQPKPATLSTPTPAPTINPMKSWKVFTTDKPLFSFKYPEGVLLNEDLKNKDSLGINIRIKNIKNYEDEPLGFDLKTALSDKIALDKGEYGNKAFGPYDQNLVKIGNTNAKSYLTLQLIEVCDVQFTRGLIFFIDDYQIIFTLVAPKNYSNQLSQYFTTDVNNCGNFPVWISTDNFYQDLKNGKTPSIALEWYELFDEIVSTFILDKKEVVKMCYESLLCQSGVPCMSNPASKFCECMGGKTEIKETSQGQSGTCTIDGQEFDEWEYFRMMNPEDKKYSN